MILVLCALLSVADAGPETPAPAPLSVEHLHVVIGREGDRIEVSEMWRLAGGSEPEAARLRFELPAGALAPLVSGERGGPPAIALDGPQFRLTRPLPARGLDVAYRFELPINNGVAVIRHPLPAPVASAEVVSRWTAGNATLTVEGGGLGKPGQLNNGLVALVAQVEGLSGQLVIRLGGLGELGSSLLPRATLIICVLLLLGGLGMWLRRG